MLESRGEKLKLCPNERLRSKSKQIARVRPVPLSDTEMLYNFIIDLQVLEDPPKTQTSFNLFYFGFKQQNIVLT